MNRISKKLLLAVGALLLADIAVFTRTNPFESRSAVLFLGFGLLAVNLYVLIYGIFRAYKLITGSTTPIRRRPIVIATTVSIILLALQSVGQLTLKDGIAILVISVIFIFYGSYLRTSLR